MPQLTRKQAARELDVSVSKLLRLTKHGLGKVHQGRRGRGDPTLFDTEVIATLLPPATAKPRKLAPEALRQLQRGALALTLTDSLVTDLQALKNGELHRYGVPIHMHGKFIAFLERWVRSHVDAHLRINGSR